jgi:hypothetical protein
VTVATYFRTEESDGEVMRHPTELAKPVPAHAQTKAAKHARRSVREAAASRRTQITRADVEAAYVHPAPEVEAEECLNGNRMLTAVGAKALAALASNNGHRVKATYNRGTTLPKWHVNSPDNKANPGPPVNASQYHGEVVDCETVYVLLESPRGFARRDNQAYVNGTHIRGVWLNGKLDRIEVDGVETTLRAAREVLS